MYSICLEVKLEQTMDIKNRIQPASCGLSCFWRLDMPKTLHLNKKGAALGKEAMPLGLKTNYINYLFNYAIQPNKTLVTRNSKEGQTT